MKSIKVRSIIISLVLVFSSSFVFADGVDIGELSEVDIKKSVFQWKGSKKLGSFHTGKVFLKSAKVQKEESMLKGGEFVIDLTSFTVEDLEGEWEQKFLKHMKSDDFFEVAKFPTASLKITKIEDGKARGILNIRGKENVVHIPFKKEDNTFKGVLKFDRTNFDMIYGSDSFFKSLVADKVINNEVIVEFTVALK